MASDPKKRKIEAISGYLKIPFHKQSNDALNTDGTAKTASFMRLGAHMGSGDKFASSSHASPALVTHTGGKDQRVVQAKNFAVAEAQQDHWLGSFKSFDSSFGNFIVPVIPTRTDLFR
ncbi:hypothetical protein Taro_032156 [Colocasia esculenta]|uniref:Uncharacterized protein n=1 Tax=Colocasia esculenta TaxID=4460 RepID=A0A843W130_COLES|nr:hypothetical protein [Colocasia esculenta]